MVQPVQPLERGEQPEHLPEPLRLELAKLEQVEGGGAERQGEQREAEQADGDVEDGPRTPLCPGGGRRLGGDPDQEREADKPRRQGAREHSDGGRPEGAFAHHLERDEEQREEREGGRDPVERREPRDADRVRDHARERDAERQPPRRGPQARERHEHQRRSQRIQAQRDQVRKEDHGPKANPVSGPRLPGPATGQDGIFRISRTGMPGMRAG